MGNIFPVTAAGSGRFIPRTLTRREEIPEKRKDSIWDLENFQWRRNEVHRVSGGRIS
jgi:hypothetical protein